MTTNTGGIAAERLEAIIQRIERMEEEKAAIATDIKEIYAEAKGAGFDTKTIRAIVRLRKMDPAERQEHEALLDIYKAALGMLYDTPLGSAARRRLAGKPPEPDEGQSDIEEAAPPEAPPEPEPDTTTIEQAREMGTKAAGDGKAVTSNPFPAQDARRAAWDEAWCKAAGNDGMEIPEAWQRKKPKKDGKPDDHEEAA